MSTQHTVEIQHHEYHPEKVEIVVGDSVVWTNLDSENHTATGDAFDTDVVLPEATSAPIVFPEESDHSGFQYFCRFHSMSGVVVVNPQPVVEPPWGATDWRAIANIVAANWVFDLADEFQHALETLSGADLDRVRAAWTGVEQWWSEQVGPGHPILDQAELSSHPTDLLLQLGRHARAAHLAVRPLVTRFPAPNHPGQGNDPFGKAITVLDNTSSVEVKQAYNRQQAYVSATFAIEFTVDAGNSITDAQKANYQAAKAAVSIQDYELLATHQITRLQALFGATEIDLVAFAEGAWRMTLAGEWDSPIFSLWHWLKWMEVYIHILENGQIPDLVPVELLENG